MDLKTKVLFGVSIIFILLSIFFGFMFKREQKNKKELQDEIVKLNNLLKVKNTKDSIITKVENEKESKIYLIKYLTKQITKDSVIFINSNDEFKEHIFSENTNN